MKILPPLIILSYLFSTQLFATTKYSQQEECDHEWARVLTTHSLPAKYDNLIGLCDNDLKERLFHILKQNHHSLGYDGARRIIFSTLDNNNGEVCGVYTSECLRTNRIPNSNIMNTEHTWPKSKGAKVNPAKSDIHHLYPSKSDINSTRSSYPFCEVISKKKGRRGSYLGKSKFKKTCFEPKDNHKGNVARSMLYFSIRYQKSIDPQQESFFRKWNIDDPVNESDRIRNITIQKYQGNSNVFVEIPWITQFISDF